MGYSPVLPDDRVNVSERSAAREAVLLVLGTCALVLGLTAILTVGIELLVPLVPVSLERRAAAIWPASVGDEDPRVPAVQALVDRLLVHWPDNELDIRVGVLEADAPNAMALPGGRVLVTTGLLDASTSENELAFVLGHELGHFRNRDHLRGIGRALAFALVVGAMGVGDGAAGSLVGTSGVLAHRGFDREQEHDADRFGLALLGREYGHAAGVVDVFDVLLADPDPDGSEATRHYLESHPANPERVDALRREGARLGLRFDAELEPWKHEVARP